MVKYLSLQKYIFSNILRHHWKPLKRSDYSYYQDSIGRQVHLCHYGGPSHNDIDQVCEVLAAQAVAPGSRQARGEGEHGWQRSHPGMGDTRFWTGWYDTDKSCASIFSPIQYWYNIWDQFSTRYDTDTILETNFQPDMIPIRYLKTIFNPIWYRYDPWDHFPTWYDIDTIIGTNFPPDTIPIRYLRTIFNPIWYQYDTWDQFPTRYDTDMIIGTNFPPDTIPIR